MYVLQIRMNGNSYWEEPEGPLTRSQSLTIIKEQAKEYTKMLKETKFEGVVDLRIIEEVVILQRPVL